MFGELMCTWDVIRCIKFFFFLKRSSREKINKSCMHTLLWLHQGFQTICGTCSAPWERGGVFGELEGFFIFLGADQTQNGFVEELVLFLLNKSRQNCFPFVSVQCSTCCSNNKMDCFNGLKAKRTMSVKIPGLIRLVILATR